MEESSFEVTALNDYKADLASELSLVGGESYTVLQTSESGWWYAANRDGETGWVPSNFVLREEQQEQELESQEQRETGGGMVENTGNKVVEQSHEQQSQDSEPPQVQNMLNQVTQAVQQSQGDSAPQVNTSNMKDVGSESVDDLLEFVEANIGPDGDAFNMSRSLRMVAFKMQEEGPRRDLVAKGGFDKIVNIMDRTTADIAVQMTCLQAIALISIDHGCDEIVNSSTTNPLQVIHHSLEVIDHYQQFNILAFNTICNVATHMPFREKARDVNIANTIINRVLESDIKEDYYTSSCLALRNLLVDQGIRQKVSGNLINLVTDVLDKNHDPRTQNAACGILVNIAQDPHLAKEIIDGGGFERLQDLIKKTDLEPQSKKTAVEVMHNLCITASQLDIDAVAVITFLSSVLDMDTQDLQVLALKALSAFSANCPDRQLLLRTLVETGALVQALDVGLKMEDEEEKKIALNIICFLGQDSTSASLLEDEVVSAMINVAPTMNDPVVIRNMLVLFYHMAEKPEGQAILLDSDMLRMMSLVDPCHEATLQAMLGIIVRCAQNQANAEPLLEKQVAIKRFCDNVPSSVDNLVNLKNGVLQLLQQLEVNNATQIKIRQKEGNHASQVATPHVKRTTRVQKTNSIRQNAQPARRSQGATPVKTQATETTPPEAPAQKTQAPVKTQAPPPVQQQQQEEDLEPAELDQGASGDYIALDVLRNRTFDRSAVDVKKLESYLDPKVFQEVFGMDKKKFEKLKGWKRVQLKKRAKLF